jgi:putative methyltransferase (TIGR04325 family)
MSELPVYEYLPGGWPPHGEQSWEHGALAAEMAAKFTAFRRMLKRKGPLNAYPGSPDQARVGGHNVAMTLGYVLARAMRDAPHLRVLDWGGSLGHTALLAGALYPDLKIDLTVKEVAAICDFGRMATHGVRYETDDAACFAREYDLAMASGSLHCVEDWRSILAQLARVAKPWLYITRLPVTHDAPSYVLIQRPPGSPISYPCWVLNRDEFLDAAAATGVVLEREFVVDLAADAQGAPAPALINGFLLRAPN